MSEPGFDREPCMWTSTVPGYNKKDRERVSVVDGRYVTERVPQTGSLGTYDDRRPAPARRWFTFVRHEGHRVSFVLTNAAAHLDTTTPYAANEIAMARHLGWFYVGSCPLALLTTGELLRGQIVATDILAEQPCVHGSYGEEKPCKHALAEEAARKAKNAQLEADRTANYKDPTDRMIEAQREEARANREAQRELISSIVEAKAGEKRK